MSKLSILLAFLFVFDLAAKEQGPRVYIYTSTLEKRVKTNLKVGDCVGISCHFKVVSSTRFGATLKHRSGQVVGLIFGDNRLHLHAGWGPEILKDIPVLSSRTKKITPWLRRMKKNLEKQKVEKVYLYFEEPRKPAEIYSFENLSQRCLKVNKQNIGHWNIFFLSQKWKLKGCDRPFDL